jgi:hypothetical protein
MSAVVNAAKPVLPKLETRNPKQTRNPNLKEVQNQK